MDSARWRFPLREVPRGISKAVGSILDALAVHRPRGGAAEGIMVLTGLTRGRERASVSIQRRASIVVSEFSQT